MDEHGWHMFDVEKGYMVRRVDDDEHPWQARKIGDEEVTRLTTTEFNQWRMEGKSPKGLE